MVDFEYFHENLVHTGDPVLATIPPACSCDTEVKALVISKGFLSHIFSTSRGIIDGAYNIPFLVFNV